MIGSGAPEQSSRAQLAQSSTPAATTLPRRTTCDEVHNPPDFIHEAPEWEHPDRMTPVLSMTLDRLLGLESEGANMLNLGAVWCWVALFQDVGDAVLLLHRLHSRLDR